LIKTVIRGLEGVWNTGLTREAGMTIGEDRVRVRYNTYDNSLVYKIKRSTGYMIDICEEMKERGSGSPEMLRCLALAQTTYEQAAMWAVKALTTE
jgi:hypothetical protein